MRAPSTLAATGLVGVLTATSAAPATAVPATDFEMPFACAQDWNGSTRPTHSPSTRAIDWNRDGDLDNPVVSAGAGVVSRVQNLGNSSYGRYVVVDHRGGESTLYAHLSADYVTLGQRVDQGELLGRVGSSGNSTGPHLHYEQRRDGVDRRAWFHGEPFAMGSTLASRNCVDTPVAGDWNGDGTAQLGLFRRGRHASYRLAWGPDVHRVRFGGRVDTPLAGDWGGDGVCDVGVRRGGSRTFVLRRSDGSLIKVRYGRRSDRGIAGDWDRDGVAEVGVWRPRTATFYLRYSSGHARRFQLGSRGSQPVTGDWNGDGRTDIGVFSAGTWTLQVLRAHRAGWRGTIHLGGTGDLPVTGDWNGDGATDLGTWTPSTARFVLRKAPPGSTAPGTLLTRSWGRHR